VQYSASTEQRSGQPLPDGEVIWVAGATGEADYTSLDAISFDTT
jgi:hypothetical protein